MSSISKMIQESKAKNDDFDNFNPKKFVQDRIREGKEIDERRKRNLEKFAPRSKKQTSKKIVKIDKKVLRALAGLVKKKAIHRQVVRKGKKPVLVLRMPTTIEKAKSMFFRNEFQVGRGV